MGPSTYSLLNMPFIYKKNLGNQKIFSLNKEVNKMLGIFQRYVATEQGLFGWIVLYLDLVPSGVRSLKSRNFQTFF